MTLTDSQAYEEIFGVPAQPNPRQDVLHRIGELREEIARLYLSIGDTDKAEREFPPYRGE